jgi:hypothetical protein
MTLKLLSFNPPLNTTDPTIDLSILFHNTVKCIVGPMTKITSSRSDEWIYWCSFTITLQITITYRIYKTIILPVVLYGCETWSLTLREEHKLRVFENRVLRRIFGPKRDEVTGGWRNYIMKSFITCTLLQV